MKEPAFLKEKSIFFILQAYKSQFLCKFVGYYVHKRSLSFAQF